MDKDIIIKMHTFDPKCKYKLHQRPGSFKASLLAPKGMCLDAYFSAYPYCLGLMYGAQFRFMKDPNTITFQCPSPTRPIVIEARRIRLGRKRIKVMMRVIDILRLKNSCEDSCKGRCSAKIGQEFEFNHMGQCPQMCPAGFLHIFPYLTTLLRGGRVPWATGKNSFLVHCPDERINVSYEVVFKPKRRVK